MNVTANDLGDGDTGPNNLQNFPVLTASAGGVQGTLNGIPNTTFRIEFFSNTTCDASGNGEGATLAGAATVSTDGTGNATIPLFTAAFGQFVTATATDSSNNTSEFSTCVQTQAASAELAVTASDFPDPVVVGTQLGYSVTITNNGPSSATDARIGFVWNAAVTIDAATPSQGTCEMTPLLVCSFGTVADDASVTVGIAVRPNVIGPLTVTMTAQADESDPVPGNNAVAVNTTVIGGPSSFLVTSANDSGAGSLRQAILNANASTGTDLITFAIDGAGVHTIALELPLPAITETVTIDGTSQTGYSGSTLIELNGSGAGPAANGLIIEGNSTTVQALAINRFGTGGQAGSPGGSGVVLRGVGSHRVWMMYIGTNPDGTAALPNRGDGIRIENSSNNLIGGESPFANVVSGNGGAGIRLIGADTIGTNIVSNFIGTDRTGTSAIGNSIGVFIDGAASNSVGGTFGVPNIISGNTSAGVVIRGTTAQTNNIGPNFIGTSAGGLPLGNGGDGVTVSEGAFNNLVGHHTVLSQGNVIRFNAQVGVRIEGAIQNAILNNRISENGLLGIDLDGDGVTLNDTGDADAGANGRQNFPVLSFVSGSATGPTVRVTLDSAPSTQFRFDFFANPSCDASGFGEGAVYLQPATTHTATGVNGIATFDVLLPLEAAGQVVTATATSQSSSQTSEFSQCLTIPHSISLLPQTLNLPTLASAPIVIALSRPAGPDGQIVNLASSDTDVFTVPATVTVAEGETTVNATVTAGSTAGSATLQASAAGFQGDSALVVVAARAMMLNVSPLVGLNRSVDGTVQLAESAPAGGVTVTLSSNAPTIFSVTPTSLTIPAGSSSGAFTVNGLANGIGQLQATAAAFAPTSISIEVTGSSLVSLGQNLTVAPGNSAGLSLSIGIPAPAGGVTVNLISSNTSVATITPSVFIPEGLQVPATNPVVVGVGIGVVQIGATASGFAPDSTTATVTVSLSFGQTTLSVVRDSTANIQLQVSAPAPPNGLTLNVSTDNPAVATVPSTVTVVGGQTSTPVTVTGVAVGSTIVRASATGIAAATATVNVVPPPAITIGNLTIGRDLQATAIATLGAAAPAGGVSVTITSADPQLVRLSTTVGGTGQPSIVLPFSAGAANANFWVQALGDTGTIQLTASATGYATDTSTVELRPSGFIINSPSSITTTTLANNSSIQITPARLNATTLAFEQNQAVRAGLSVEVPVTSSNQAAGVITISPVTIGSGGSSANTQFDPIGQGTSTIAVGTPAGFSTPTTFRQFVATVTQPAITLGDFSVGRDLQVQVSASLGAPAPAGGVTITVTSLSPGAVLVSNSATAIGSASITLQATGGSTTVPGFWVQALADTGTPEITLSATGFTTETTTVTLAPSGFIINSPGNFSTNSFAANTSLQITSARLNQSLGFVQNQPLRAGITADVPVTSSNPTVGTITASPLHFIGGTQAVNTSFDPAQSGTTTIAVGLPAGFSAPTNFNQITATVSAPNLTLGSAAIQVGRDLQTQVTVSLQNAPPSPVDVSVTVVTGGIVALSSNATTVGGNTVVFTGVTSTSAGAFFVQGLALGSTTLTGHADGYNDDTASVTVHPSGFIINSPGSISTNTFAANTSVQITSARLNPGTLAFVQSQPLRAGIGTVNVPVTSSDTTVGVITASPLTFGPNVQAVNTTFDALSSGTTTIAVGTPAGFDTSSSFRQISATVTAPNVNISSVIVGRDLQTQISVTLDVAPPSPITVTVRSNATSVATLTANGTVAGGDTVTFTNVTSTFAGSFFVQGRSLGTTTLTGQAAGYDDATANVTVDPSGFIINSPQVISTNTLAAPTSVQITPARLNPSNLNFVQSQAVRGGLSVDVPVTVSNPAVGVMTVSPVTLGPGVGSANTAFNPESVGTTVISVGTPAGFSSSSSFTQVTATVVTPGINVSAVRVGRDLQTLVTITLDATPPSPITVTVQSDAIATATITQNGLLEGGVSIAFNNVTSTNVGSFFVQGRSIGTTTLTTLAVGYELSTSSVTVDPSGFIINSPASITTTAGAQNTPVQISPSRLDPISFDWAGNQSVRGGLSVNVPVTSSNPSVGVMTITSVPFGPGVSFSNTAFDPLAVGTTTISVAPPAGFTQSGTFSQITATVNQ